MKPSTYNRERHFVRIARQTLKALELFMAANDHQLPDTGKPSMFQALAVLKQAALSVQARAVYRGAVQFEEAAAKQDEDPLHLAQAFHRLRALVGFYTDGLLELDPTFAREVNPTSVLSSCERSEDLQTARLKARAALKPLLSLVKTATARQALSTLMEYQGAAPVDIGRDRGKSIDEIFRQLTNRLLAEARLGGQDVSISYGADFETLPQVCADSLQAGLMGLAVAIVRHGLARSVGKKSLQIEINAQIIARNVSLSLSWPGRVPTNNPGFDKAKEGFETSGGHIESRDLTHGRMQVTLFYPLQEQTNKNEPVRLRAGEG